MVWSDKMVINELNIKPVFDNENVAQISFLTQDINAVNNLLKVAGKTALEAEIKPLNNKRSCNANSYMWVLCDKIAEAIHATKEEVYKEAIRHVGIFQDVACTAQGLPALIETWTSRGIGWIVDTFDSKLQGCKRVRLYTGSHLYDTKQMTRLVDYIVEEAKNLGIETMTPQELKQMLEVENGTSL